MRSLDLSSPIAQVSAAEWQQLQILAQTRKELAGTGFNYFFRATPLGPLLVVYRWDGLTALEFPETRDSHKLLQQIVAAIPGTGLSYDAGSSLARLISYQLDAYFSGALREFTLPLYEVGTSFQRRVWQCLRGIGYGETISYAEESRRLGQPQAVRAVAAANGRNKISIVVPCHRVIASTGQLHGYGGGLERKAALLNLERGQPLAPSTKWQALNALLRD